MKLSPIILFLTLWPMTCKSIVACFLTPTFRVSCIRPLQQNIEYDLKKRTFISFIIFDAI